MTQQDLRDFLIDHHCITIRDTLDPDPCVGISLSELLEIKNRVEKDIIDKSCEWLEKHIPSNYTSNTITFVEQFRKAMK